MAATTEVTVAAAGDTWMPAAGRCSWKRTLPGCDVPIMVWSWRTCPGPATTAGSPTPCGDAVAWSAVQTSKTAVAALWRIDWDSVGRICDRVAADALAETDPLDGLRRIGIDEISYRKGHRYLVVVVDHDTGRLVWAKPGRTKAVVAEFFEALGPERRAGIEIVTADGASWISDAVAEAAPDAEVCMDPFHVVGWATDALDAVRREDWNDLRHTQGDRRGAKILKGLRWLLWRNWEDLTPQQRERLDILAATHSRLHRAWQLKEVLRQIFQLPYLEAKMQLDDWLAWASRSRIPAFVELARRIRRHRPAIERTLQWRVSNGLVESTNTKIRLIHRRAFGFRRPESLISLAMLALGGYW